MTIAPVVRSIGFIVALTAPLLGPVLSSAQEQPRPPSPPSASPPPSPSSPSPDLDNARAAFPAPVGHRQPRAADIPQMDKTAAELLDEKQQDELNRKLRICSGC